MTRTTTCIAVTIGLVAALCATAFAAPRRMPLRYFARMVFHQDNEKDPGRYIGETSVREYRNRETGVSVVVISTSHVGSKAYFRSLEQFTKNAEIILAEGRGGHPPGSDVSDEKIPEQGLWIRRFMRAQAAILGYITESEGLKHAVDKRWVLADMNVNELAAAMDKLGEPIVSDELKQSVLKLEKVIETGSREERSLARVEAAKRMFGGLSGDTLPRPEAAKALDELSEQRDVVMWNAIKKTIASGKHKRIVFFAGARHTRQVAPKLIIALGFSLYSTTWREFLDFGLGSG